MHLLVFCDIENYLKRTERKYTAVAANYISTPFKYVVLKIL